MNDAIRSGDVGLGNLSAVNHQRTVNGKALTLKVVGGSLMVDGAKVTKADIAASNGVIHVIDTVVMP